MRKIAAAMIENARAMIHSIDFCERHKEKASHFTRMRCMGFISLMMLCLNFMKKSTQVEIDRFMELTDPEIERTMSKQAFSKARRKISAEAFIELFEGTGQTAIELDGFGRYKGYRVFAIDGTDLRLPKSAEISSFFMQTRGSFSPHARASVLCDVVTGITVHASIDSTQTGERDLAMEHIRYFEQYRQSKDLIIFDRGYPSKAMISYLDSHGFKYLMRLQSRFYAEIDASKKHDFYVQLDGCNVRALKFTLPGGEQETLITNLGRKVFKLKDFAALYHMRWGVETKYNTLKNKLDIEDFSGKSLLTIQQDFYATLFLSNIAAALKADANDIIREDNAAKSLKHEYIANENILIGKLKDKLVLIMLNRDPNKRALLLDRLISQLARNRTPVVPDRHFERPATSHKRAVCRVKRAL